MTKSNYPHTWVVILVVLAISYSQSVTAQGLIGSNQCFGITRGREFVVGFTENTDEYAASRQLSILVVAFSDEDTEVTISSKHQVAGHPLQESFMIKARGFRRTIIPVDYMMNGTEGNLKGIKVTASSYVSVYGLMYQDYTTDGFLGIPTNNLGMQYIVTTVQPDRTALFAVIGTQDSTTVQVTLRNTVIFQGQTYNRGDILTFEVSDLEAVQIQSVADLTGSIIQSDKPVAVFSGNECVSTPGSFCDILTEQLVPVKSWGKEHIYTAAQDTDRNIYRIVAYFTGTNVTIPGVANQVLNAGDFWEGRLTGSGLVSSDQPTLMMQVLASIEGQTVDPSLIQIPSKDQFGFVFGFTTPPFSGGDSKGYFNFINIVVHKDARQTVHLNGLPINSADVHERDIPGTSYSVITVQLPKGEGVYYVEQTDQLSSPLSVIVYGYEDHETYGYAAGLSLPSNKQLFSVTPYYFREIGGETMTITVPCFETNVVVLQDAMCKFETGIGDVLVPGDRIGFYTVICITPTFYKVGVTQVSVSIDEGESFSHSGVIYVASQVDLPPLVTLEQENQDTRGGTIDLTTDDAILLSWDPEVMGTDVSHVDLMLQDSELNDEDFPVLGEGITVMSNVLNSGNLNISSTIVRSVINEVYGITVGAYYLTPSGGRMRRGVLNVLGKAFKAYTAVRVIGYFFGDELCSLFEGQLVNEPVSLPPCPCTSNQAATEPGYKESNFLNSFFHPGAETCYRSTTATPMGAGQQCCYGKDGSIIFGPPGGGTADRYSPDNYFWRHQWYDVVPWLACCHFAKQKVSVANTVGKTSGTPCEKYYGHRPSDDCSEYDPPRPARASGDPHITTLDGKMLTFNGAGEFLMLSSTLHSVTFQARMEVFRNTNASVYTAFAIQTNDSVKVQVQKSFTANNTVVLIDGDPLRLTDSLIRNYYLKGVHISVNKDLSEVRTIFDVGISLIINVNTEAMSFIAQLDTKFQGQVNGLLGNMNGDPADDLRFPNGTILNSNSSLQEIHEFGLEWLVTESESVLTYISPFDYSTYYFPNFIPTFDVPDPNDVSQEIRDLCGDSVECLFDAVTTGSLSFANETLTVSTTFEQIKKYSVKIVSCGFPGEVENGNLFGSVYFVNDTVQVTCVEGFTLEGASTLTCQEDGYWSSEIPLCEALDENGLNKSVIIIIICVIGGVALIGILVFVVYRIKRK